MRLIIAEYVRKMVILAYSLMTDHAYTRLNDAEKAFKNNDFKRVEGFMSQLTNVFDNKVNSYGDHDTILKNMYVEASNGYEMAYNAVKTLNKPGKTFSELERNRYEDNINIGIKKAKDAMEKAAKILTKK